jgi:RNA polymerase sigma factor (sigma-70 family)
LGNSLATLPNENELVARAVSKPAAFAAIYDHYFPRVYNYARYRVGDAGVTDEITARVFERALARIDSYRPKQAPFSAWLFGIARNTVNQHLRTQKRRRWISLDLVSNRRSASPDPEEVLIQSETHSELIEAISQLNERERDILALKFASGMTNRHIAKLNGLGESNVSVILYRSIRKLRDQLKSRETNHE